MQPTTTPNMYTPTSMPLEDMRNGPSLDLQPSPLPTSVSSTADKTDRITTYRSTTRKTFGPQEYHETERDGSIDNIDFSSPESSPKEETKRKRNFMQRLSCCCCKVSKSAKKNSYTRSYRSCDLCSALLWRPASTGIPSY